MLSLSEEPEDADGDEVEVEAGEVGDGVLLEDGAESDDPSVLSGAGGMKALVVLSGAGGTKALVC